MDADCSTDHAFMRFVYNSMDICKTSVGWLHPVGSEWCKKLTPRESGPPGFDSCFCAVVTGSITVDTRPARVSMDQFHERVSTEATGVSRWFTLWIIGSMYELSAWGREADAHIG